MHIVPRCTSRLNVVAHDVEWVKDQVRLYWKGKQQVAGSFKTDVVAEAAVQEEDVVMYLEPTKQPQSS